MYDTPEVFEHNRRQLFNSLAHMLDLIIKDIYGEPRGFLFIAFPFDDNDGKADYVSNGKREDMIKFMKETIERFEKEKADGE
ncbi:MAG: hypothetical protein DRJ03_01070 [Chloroflexi bacterium]|nr:MAG: hypothetical protein DRJ03_01070 [Chloroflexota bacterium]